MHFSVLGSPNGRRVRALKPDKISSALREQAAARKASSRRRANPCDASAAATSGDLTADGFRRQKGRHSFQRRRRRIHRARLDRIWGRRRLGFKPSKPRPLRKPRPRHGLRHGLRRTIFLQPLSFVIYLLFLFTIMKK